MKQTSCKDFAHDDCFVPLTSKLHIDIEVSRTARGERGPDGCNFLRRSFPAASNPHLTPQNQRTLHPNGNINSG